MKRVIIVLMLALAIVGCKGKKQVYSESDVEQGDLRSQGVDVDWIGLYVRCHELDSIKKEVEKASLKMGQPLEQLPDSINLIWDNMLNEILLRKGENAFDNIFDTHRRDFERFFRLDFIYYGFITRVYLPYKATQTTKEEYGEICIKELEREMSKARRTMMYTGETPSHYDNLIKELFYAYVNNDRTEEALKMSDVMLGYIAQKDGKESLNYADMLSQKAQLCFDNDNSYSAMLAAREAIQIYDNIIASAKGDEADLKKAKEEREALASKLKLWQGK